MDMKFASILSVALLPQIIDLIVKKEGSNEISAINEFYHSKTYKNLAEEESKMWHYSPLCIYSIWKEEKETGEVVFPEGQS